ncbi:MAG: hypothetical protein SWX82_24365 [Cyanobacteriota bacterium]|nr:hypothetical protein [Cyanobacteriota bacterium]
MKCLSIVNQEKIVKDFGISNFPPANLAELSGAENLKYLSFVIMGIK